MDAIILFGSPRREGNTIQLAQAFSRELRSRGDHVRMIYLNDLNIRPCQGCLACAADGQCRINDDMRDIRKYIMESDIIVYATPLYWFAPSGQLKLVMDRSIAFIDKEYTSRVKGKKAVTLMTCAEEGSETYAPSREIFKNTFQLLGFTYEGSVEATGCAENGPVKEKFIKRAEELARSL